MTKTLLIQRLEVAKVRIKFYRNRNEDNEKQYKTINKQYRSELKAAKNKYYADKLKRAGKDSSMAWRIIREALNRKSKSDLHESISHNNRQITDKLEIANTFTTHYKNAAVDKIKALNSDMKFEQFLSEKDKMTNTFKLNSISRMETWFFIKSVPPKNSQGFDGISSKLMNSAASNLVIPMTTIINKCFSTGSFPTQLKTAKISPVFKKGNPEPSNFRPISLLSCFSKVIEKAAANQLEKHLKTNLENERQFAYKANHGCLHAILLTRHKIEMELEKGNFVCLALIDLSIAFDTVECSTTLPTKLKHYGATVTSEAFFKSFFTNRKLYTNWNGTCSTPVDLYNYSCVQGSCLGPIIFNTYTNDLRNATDSELVCFADDTNVIRSHKDPNQLIRNMNKDLNIIQNYMTENQLMLNKTKSYYLIFKPKGRKKTTITEKIYINGTEIERVSCTRFLGIWIDDELRFRKQYDILYKKLEDTVKALGAVRSLLNYRTKILIYHSLFQSHVNYCAITYFDKLNKTQLANLLQLQKKAIRNIFQTKRNVHTNKLFKLSNITPINRSYETEAMKFVFAYISDTTKDLQPKAIRKILFQNAEITRNTRLYDDESKIKINHEYKKGQAIYNLINVWNNGRSKFRFAGNMWSLKNMIRDEINNELKPCTTKDCYICQLDHWRKYEYYMRK